MEVLAKDVFLGTNDLDLVPVKLPDKYGKDVGFYVRVITGRERSEIEKQFMDAGPRTDPGGFRAAVLVRSIADAEGKPLFTPTDAAKLMGKAAGTLELLFEAACRINGFTKADVETIEKN